MLSGEPDGLEVILKLAENGVGTALMPQTAPHLEWPAGVRALGLREHTFHSDIGLVNSSRLTLTGADSCPAHKCSINDRF